MPQRLCWAADFIFLTLWAEMRTLMENIIATVAYCFVPHLHCPDIWAHGIWSELSTWSCWRSLPSLVGLLYEQGDRSNDSEEEEEGLSILPFFLKQVHMTSSTLFFIFFFTRRSSSIVRFLVDQRWNLGIWKTSENFSLHIWLPLVKVPLSKCTLRNERED